VTEKATKQPVFARRLAEARLRARLTQKQLGELAGMEPDVASPRINQYERGKHEPPLKTAKQLADVLKVPPAFLYTEDELLARLLLRWNKLSLRRRKELVDAIDPPRRPAEPSASRRSGSAPRTSAARPAAAKARRKTR
jgi:transcriptional regulator with XRE-family HTH domain